MLKTKGRHFFSTLCPLVSFWAFYTLSTYQNFYIMAQIKALDQLYLPCELQLIWIKISDIRAILKIKIFFKFKFDQETDPKQEIL